MTKEVAVATVWVSVRSRLVTSLLDFPQCAPIYRYARLVCLDLHPQNLVFWAGIH